MILYFSGTGNSEYVAKRIGKELNDQVTNLLDKMKNNDYSALKSEYPWIVITPTYAWRIPRIVKKWLENAQLNENKNIYFVMTCAGSIGNAGKYLKKLSDKKNMNYCGCAKVVMPNNYIALSTAPSEDEIAQIIERAESSIISIAGSIKNGEKISETSISLNGKINSSILYDLYYPLFVRDKKFYATDECISCGKCEYVCPLNNIQIENGKPTWNNLCTHCMACISYCPKEAIEYGKHTHGLLRYTCKKNV